MTRGRGWPTAVSPDKSWPRRLKSFALSTQLTSEIFIAYVVAEDVALAGDLRYAMRWCRAVVLGTCGVGGCQGEWGKCCLGGHRPSPWRGAEADLSDGRSAEVSLLQPYIPPPYTPPSRIYLNVHIMSGQASTAAAAATTSRFQAFMNHPAGPK